jgi:hypothetical protein
MESLSLASTYSLRGNTEVDLARDRTDLVVFFLSSRFHFKTCNYQIGKRKLFVATRLKVENRIAILVFFVQLTEELSLTK